MARKNKTRKSTLDLDDELDIPSSHSLYQKYAKTTVPPNYYSNVTITSTSNSIGVYSPSTFAPSFIPVPLTFPKINNMNSYPDNGDLKVKDTSKREYIAVAILNGFISSGDFNPDNEDQQDEAVEYAVVLTDKLLNRLEQI